MSLYNKSQSFRNVGFGILAICVGVASIAWAKGFIRIDAFARLRKPAPNGNVAIKMDDVSLRHYEGGKLVAKADAKEIDVRDDRQHLLLKDIKNGTFLGQKGPTNFSANEAQWSSVKPGIEITKGAKFSGKDFGFGAQHLLFNPKTSGFEVVSPLSGSLYGGPLTANSAAGNLKKGTVRINGVDYSVRPSQTPLSGTFAQDGEKRWRFKCASAEHIDADTDVYTDAEATVYQDAKGADVDFIIRAPKFVHKVKADTLITEGRAEYYSVKANMIADKVVIYQQERRAVLTGRVLMMIKPKDEQAKPMIEQWNEYKPVTPEQVQRGFAPTVVTDDDKKLDDEARSASSLRKYPATVYATKIEYWYGKGSRHAKINGSPQGYQMLPGSRWRRVWANQAEYDGEAERMHLISSEKEPVRVKNWKGDDTYFGDFTFSTEEDNEWYKGLKAHGDVYSDDQDVNGGGSKPKPPAKSGGQPSSGAATGGAATGTPTTGGGTSGSTTGGATAGSGTTGSTGL